MSCNSAIYCVLADTDVSAGGQIPFGTVVRRFGPSITVDGPGITCCGVGYYSVDCVATVTPVAAGEVGVQLYADGSPIPGATATATATAGSPVAVPVAAMVRQRCCGAVSLSARLVTPDGVTTGATVAMSTRAEKI